MPPASQCRGLHSTADNQQITQLCRVSDSKHIVLNFDADGAGVRAANRAIGEVEQLAMRTSWNFGFCTFLQADRFSKDPRPRGVQGTAGCG